MLCDLIQMEELRKDLLPDSEKKEFGSQNAIIPLN